MNNRVFAENLVAVVLQSVSYVKPILTQEELIALGKSGPNATCNLFFLLGWVGLGLGGFVGFMIVVCFPTQHNLVIGNTLIILIIVNTVLGLWRGITEHRPWTIWLAPLSLAGMPSMEGVLLS